ncbi:MAG: helix-turn-helix domain-containing protein [Bacteroidales bacterium]|nr:helix-turn-helix domain-containing protein [Bacteroidales bacterium]
MSCAGVWAQSTLGLQRYTIMDKVSKTRISQFVQDDKGYIWLGTLDGLMRFDGQHTSLYKTYPGDSIHVENHRIMRLLRAKSGNLWITTYGRYCYLFDTDRYCYCNPLAANGNEVSQIYCLDNGATWTFDGKDLFQRVDDGKSPWEILPTRMPFQFSQLNNIALDYAGNEWMLTDKGAYIFTRSRFINLPNVRFLANIGEHIYLATTNQVYSYHLNTATLENLNLDLKTDIKQLKVLKNGYLLLCQHRQFSLVNPLTRSKKTYDVETESIIFSLEDSRQRLWLLGNEDEVFLIANDELRTIPYHGDRLRSATTEFQIAFEDDFGTIWIQPGRNKPLAYYNDDEGRLEQAFIYQDGKRKLIQEYVRSGVMDRQNNLWGNIDGEGFCCFSFDRQRYSFVNGVTDATPDYEVSAQMQDSQHRIWIGWRENAKSDRGEIALYSNDHHLLGYLASDGSVTSQRDKALSISANCMYQDRLGRIWIGTHNKGLYILAPQDKQGVRYTVYHYERDKTNPIALIGSNVMSVIEDYQGRIWIGAYGHGLDCLTDTRDLSHLRFIHRDDLTAAQRHISILCETSEHRLLVGHNNGLLVADLSADSIVFRQNQCNADPRSLASNNVTHLTELKDGRILVSTFGGGLNILPAHFAVSDTLHFTHLNARHGGIPDVVFSTLEDDSGNILVMAENSLQTYTADFQPRKAYIQDLPCNRTPAMLDTENHRLYLPAKHDVLCFTKHNMQRSKFEPNIVFTRLAIHNNDSTSVITSLTPADTALFLQAEERNFTLDFVALDYRDQSGIQYAYRITPHLDQWIPLQNQSSVNVANIPGGDYVLEVRSTNSDGVWTSKKAQIQVHIEPYVTETLWFKVTMWIIYLAFFALIVYTIMHRIDERRKSAMQNKLSEAKVKFITEVTQQQDSADEIFTRRLMRLIQDNVMNENFTMEQAASDLNMSYPVLYRKVKAIMDMTPVELVRQVRMQRAQRLLTARPDMAIVEVASQCGFGSPQYFNRVFKEMNHCTPAEYKKRAIEQRAMEQHDGEQVNNE